MKHIFYYLTEDSRNKKEKNEIEYLSSIGKVIVVTRGYSSKNLHNYKIKYLNLPPQSGVISLLCTFWTKLCYLLCRTSNSLTDKGFPSRNVYTGNKIIRWVVNSLWPAKYSCLFRWLLPKYETLYFAPFSVCLFFFRKKKKTKGCLTRIIVHDALVIRITKFTLLILHARKNGIFTIANVKSWDNPYYSQFITGANAYLTWSESMWSDVERIHQIRAARHHSWGPRPFYNFACSVHQSEAKFNQDPSCLMIGYAAAFCDVLMAEQEVKIIRGLAADLQSIKPEATILFRPYPTVPLEVYGPLQKLSNIEIIDINGPTLDRYGDGRETIRFGSDEERIKYLSRCHVFLSIATSFTFEAAIFGLPIIQYFIPKHNRYTEDETVFFDRLDISDHIINYYVPYLTIAKNTCELMDILLSLEKDPSLRRPPTKMMSIVGFPSKLDEWNSGSANLLKNIDGAGLDF